MSDPISATRLQAATRSTPGNRDPAGHRVSQFLVLLAELLQPGVERLDLGFEEAILAEQAIQQEPM
jgi:hypothetical protein